MCQASCDRSRRCYKHANYDQSEQLIAIVAGVITKSIWNHLPFVKEDEMIELLSSDLLHTRAIVFLNFATFASKALLWYKSVFKSGVIKLGGASMARDEITNKKCCWDKFSLPCSDSLWTTTLHPDAAPSPRHCGGLLASCGRKWRQHDCISRLRNGRVWGKSGT